MILVAMESRTIRGQVERLLAAAGLDSVTAASLAEARQVLADKTIAAVVLDEWLTDGEGQQLLEEIRRADGDHLPVVSLGGTRADGDLQPDARIPKPEMVAHLVEVLRSQLSAHTEERTLGRILVVDDSLTYREQLRASLERVGYLVVTAASGEEAVRVALEHAPDAMLVDSMLPGISGAQVIRRIRGEVSTRRTPCCLLTASEDPAQELDALDAGADAFVRKDEALAVILARLAGILRSASTPAAATLAALPLLPRRAALIAEDAASLDTLAATLLEDGCELIRLRPDQATVEYFASFEPDILVLSAAVDDAVLAFCREVKQQAQMRNSRLLLLDLNPNGNAAVSAIQAGADDYLAVGSEESILLARARSQLRRKRMEDENRGLREHILRKELETEVQRALAEARSRHADEMRIASAVAEEKAQEAERARLELEQITEGIPQIVWTSRARSRQARLNRRWTDYTGLPNHDISAHLWRQAVHPEDRRRALHDWYDADRIGRQFSSEYRLRSSAGEYRWFLVRAIPLSDEQGRLDRWFGTCTDVQDQKLNEEALRRTEKLAATGRLAASIAHEINNPLEAVTNLLYLIEGSTRDDPGTHDYVAIAQKELDRVAQISKKTLAFYRESSTTAPVDLCALVREVEDIYSVRLERKGLHLRLEEDCGVRPLGLAGELRQVISNLVTNAIDASPEHGEIRVRIRNASRWQTVGEHSTRVAGARISVADRGHGIPAAIQRDIFKPFVTTKGAKGTGLGLWLSHSIVDRHGGTLQLRSSTGACHGTCFSIFLPLELGHAPAEADSVGSMLRTIGKELLGETS